jgi:hypothetical protein
MGLEQQARSSKASDSGASRSLPTMHLDAVFTRKNVLLFVGLTAIACLQTADPPSAILHRKTKSALHFSLKFRIMIFRRAFSGKENMWMHFEATAPAAEPMG